MNARSFTSQNYVSGFMPLAYFLFFVVMFVVVWNFLFSSDNSGKFDHDYQEAIDKLPINDVNLTITDIQAKSIADAIYTEFCSTWSVNWENCISMFNGLNQDDVTLVFKQFGLRNMENKHLGLITWFTDSDFADLFGWIRSFGSDNMLDAFKQIFNFKPLVL